MHSLLGRGPTKSVSPHSSPSAVSLRSFRTAPVLSHNRGSRRSFDFSLDFLAETRRPAGRGCFPRKCTSPADGRCSSSRCCLSLGFGSQTKAHRETRVSEWGVTSLWHRCRLCRVHNENRGKDHRGETPSSLHLLSSPRIFPPLLVLLGGGVNSFLFPGLFSSARESAPVLVWCAGTVYGSAVCHGGRGGVDGVCGGRGAETVG